MANQKCFVLGKIWKKIGDKNTYSNYEKRLIKNKTNKKQKSAEPDEFEYLSARCS